MSGQTQMRVAAIQIDAEVGNVDHNLEACQRQIESAVAQGAQWIVLPEFFATGVAFLPELAQHAPLDGPPTELLVGAARRFGVFVGGSTLVRDEDGHVRNAFLLGGPAGTILGRHDKDIPTMWENALYIGGQDPGRIAAGELTVGVALCWELMRTHTIARLKNQVDVVLGGSGWWSVPDWPLLRSAEKRNARRALAAPAVFARAIGVPVIHAAHAGQLSCRLPGTPLTYRGHYQGGAQVCGADGTVLAIRERCEGDSVAVADLLLAGHQPGLHAPERFWLQRRGVLPALGWAYQRALGKRFYDRSIRPHSNNRSAVTA